MNTRESKESGTFANARPRISERDYSGPSATAKAVKHDLSAEELSKKPLGWSYLAGYFDANGSLRENKLGKGPRLRVNSYSRHLLEEIRGLVDGGSISREQKPRGEYYRLDITGLEHVQRVLREISPFLRVKTVRGEEWLNLHERSVLLYRIGRELRRIRARLH